MTAERGRSNEPIFRVLGLLDRVKRSGSGWEARCPGPRHKHEDKHPSLSVGLGSDGRVLLNCKTGCEGSEILAALNLEWSDLFERSASGNPIRRFRLLNKTGQVVAEHLREDLPAHDKRMWWEHDGKRGLNGTPMVDLPLYHLPELLAAEATATVIVTEGEQAADALTSLGLLAVGTVTGANKTPSDSVLEALEGHEVWLWADNDVIGKEHMASIATRLRAPPRWIVWPDAPPKGDAADYVAAGGSAEGVAALVRQTPVTPLFVQFDGPKIWTGPQLAAMAFDAPRWAIPDLLPAGLAILAGRPKLGKSWLGLGWALDIPRPSPALKKMKVVQGETLYLALEDGPRRMQERMALMLGETPPPVGFNVVTEWPRTNEGGLELLDQWLNAHPDARLVVVDTFKRIRPLEKNTQRLYDLDYDAISPLAELARRHNVAIVLVFHTRKAVSDDPLESVSGTLGVSGAADAVLVLRRERGQADASLFVTGRDVEEQDLALRWEKEDTLGWALLGDAETFRRSKERQLLVDAVRAMPGMTPLELSDAVGKSRGSVRYLLFKLVQESELRVREGRYYPGQAVFSNTPPNSANSPITPLTANTPVSAVSTDRTVSPVSAVRAVVCRECGTRRLLPHETTGICSVCINKDEPA